MAAETNLTDVQALGQALAIDFTSQFETELNKLTEALGITSKIPMNVGNSIKQYRHVVTPPAEGGNVAEGDIIPLTQVQRELARTVELSFKKYRKSTSMEAVQAHGYEVAVSETDRELLRHAKKEIRSEFFSFLADAAAANDALSAPNLQGAIAHGSAAVQDVLDDDLTPVVLANPHDVADHLADGQINSDGAAFGVNLLSNYVGARILTNRDVPQGTVYVTAAENLQLAYANPRGEIGRSFNFVTDDSGYIGVLHDAQEERLTYDTVIASAVTLFPDVVDAVVAVNIEEPVAGA